MGQAQINVRTRACSRTSIARTKQAALTHAMPTGMPSKSSNSFRSDTREGKAPTLQRRQEYCPILLHDIPSNRKQVSIRPFKLLEWWKGG